MIVTHVVALLWIKIMSHAKTMPVLLQRPNFACCASKKDRQSASRSSSCFIASCPALTSVAVCLEVITRAFPQKLCMNMIPRKLVCLHFC